MVLPFNGSELTWQEESVIKRYRAGRAAGLVIASALAVSALAAAPAMAGTSTNIDGNGAPSGTSASDYSATGVSKCLSLGTVANNNQPYFCMYYSPGYGNGVWGAKVLSQDPITATFGGSGSGVGQAVRDNAASMANPTPLCNLTTWTGSDYTGLDNWLDPDSAGNLTDSSSNNVRNHDYIVGLNTGPGC